MVKRIAMVLAVGALAFGALGAGHGGQASDNASCFGQAQSQMKGPHDKDLARALAQNFGQNENSNGVGAWAKFASEQDC